MHVSGYASTGFYATSAANGYTRPDAAADNQKSRAPDGETAATNVTLSDAARAAAEEPDFASVIAAARETLNGLLSDAERSSPLKDGKLALDMSSLDQRALYAISSTDDGLFTSDERKAATLEMERRFDLALSGPLGVSEVTGDYRTLYEAAAAHLDGLSAEQKAQPGWQAARAAIDKALVALDADPETLPQSIADDPVAAWLAGRADDEADAPDNSSTLAENLRTVLDKRYAALKEAGVPPAFDPNRKGYIDLGEFDSKAISAMALNREGLFSSEEVRAANGEMHARANAALSEGLKSANRSGDPTAFSRNVISLYSSMSADERAAAGFSDALLNSAIASYESTQKVMNIISSGMQASGGVANWFSR